MIYSITEGQQTEEYKARKAKEAELQDKNNRHERIHKVFVNKAANGPTNTEDKLSDRNRVWLGDSIIRSEFDRRFEKAKPNLMNDKHPDTKNLDNFDDQSLAAEMLLIVIFVVILINIKNPTVSFIL